MRKLDLIALDNIPLISPGDKLADVIFNSINEVVIIGKIASVIHEVHGEFIGMMKLTNRGAEIFKQNFF